MSSSTGSPHRWSPTCKWMGTWSFNQSTSSEASRAQTTCVVSPSLTYFLLQFVHSHVPLFPLLGDAADPEDQDSLVCHQMALGTAARASMGDTRELWGVFRKAFLKEEEEGECTQRSLHSDS